MKPSPSSLFRAACFVLAGGAGERLLPLTWKTPKPLLPFGGVQRLIDFTLANIANSRLERAYVLSEYMRDEFADYLRGHWEPSYARPTRFIHQPPDGSRRYRGTADAVRRNLDRVPCDSDLVLVLEADYVYRMDYRILLDHHARSGAGATVAAGLPEGEGRPDTAGFGLAVFNRWTFLQAVSQLEKAGTVLDVGQVIGALDRQGQVAVYPTGDAAYRRAIDTIDAYFDSNMELLAGGAALDPFDPEWPVRSRAASPFEYGAQRPGSKPWPGSIVSPLALLEDCAIEQSILAPGVTVEAGADIRRSILLPGAHVGREASVRNAIIDVYGSVGAREEIGYHRIRDRQSYTVSGSGVVVVASQRREKVRAVAMGAPRALPRPGRIADGAR